MGGQHAVPALEAGDLPGRRVRPVHRPLARRASSAKGEVRTQYAHIIDMVPTVLDVLGIERTGHHPRRDPIAHPGVSFGAHPSRRRRAQPKHRTQYFEMLGHRAIYHDGWRAVCPWPGPSFAEAGRRLRAIPSPPTSSPNSTRSGWELYHVDEDFAENHNLADDNRDKLIEMIATWYVEAGKYDVLPVDGSGLARMIGEKPLVALPRDRYVYFPDTQSVPFFAGPRVLNRPHSITAEVEIPDGGAEGVLLCQGTRRRRVSRCSSKTASCTTSTTTSPARRAGSRPTEPFPPAGTNCASSSSQPARWTSERPRRPRPASSFTSTMLSSARQTCPTPHPSPTTPAPSPAAPTRDRPSPTTTRVPFRFTGTLHTVTIDISGELITDSESEFRLAMARR